MKIVERKISELIEAEYNPRKLSEKQEASIRASLEEFGFVDPCIINMHESRLNIIIGGHQRKKVWLKMGNKTIPCVELELEYDRERELNIRLNQNTGEWDFELLDELFDKTDLLDWGFEPFDFQPMKKPGKTDPDDVPEAPKKAKTKLGDLYVLGDHRLLCGDSTNIEHAEILMDGQKAHMVFTDPPYNIDYGNIKHPKFKVRSIQNDNMSTDQFVEFCAVFVSCIKSLCKGCVYVFGHPGPDGRIMFHQLDIALHCSTTIVWNKDVFTLGRGKYQNKYEPCWFGWNENGSAFTKDRKLTNVWDFPRPKASKLHPTMKPVELIEYAISHATTRQDRVLDLFGGSGSTIMACEQTDRKCRMMELDPIYCDVIVTRWQAFTGKKAVLQK